MSDQSLKDHRPVPVTTRSSRIVAVIIVAVLSLAVLAGVFLFVRYPSGNSLSFGPSQKVCQLTGDTDWDTEAATTARTESNFGFLGTDLGYPVEYNAGNHPNGMALFFGDSRFNPPRRIDAENPESGEADDAIGWVSTQTPPTKDNCLGLMTINAKSPTVVPQAIKQGLFNVPTGGVSSDGVLYGFFWTDHCLHDTDPSRCPGTDSLNKWGSGYLARYRDEDRIEDSETFADPVPLPTGFVLSTAVDSEAAVGLPEEQRLGIYVFGVPHYRASVPYLAYAPPGTIADPWRWKFFIGRKPDGQPSWTSREVWEIGVPEAHPPGHPELFEANSNCDRSVGEFSMTWNRALHVWLLMYQRCNPSGRGGQVVVVRVAAAPWGPWSDESILLDPNRDSPWCHLLWQTPEVKDCGKLRNDVEKSETNIANLNNEIKDATGTLKVSLKAKLALAQTQLDREKEALAKCEKASPPPPPPPGGVSGGCDDRHKDEWIDDDDKAGVSSGEFYAPYVMERYTGPEQTGLPYRRRATIYWLVSTWNPYQVIVMKTSLTIDESATVRVLNGIRSVFGGK